MIKRSKSEQILPKLQPGSTSQAAPATTQALPSSWALISSLSQILPICQPHPNLSTSSLTKHPLLMVESTTPGHSALDPLTTCPASLTFLKQHASPVLLRKRQIAYYKEARPELRPVGVIGSNGVQESMEAALKKNNQWVLEKSRRKVNIEELEERIPCEEARSVQSALKSKRLSAKK